MEYIYKYMVFFLIWCTFFFNFISVTRSNCSAAAVCAKCCMHGGYMYWEIQRAYIELKVGTCRVRKNCYFVTHSLGFLLLCHSISITYKIIYVYNLWVSDGKIEKPTTESDKIANDPPGHYDLTHACFRSIFWASATWNDFVLSRVVSKYQNLYILY